MSNAELIETFNQWIDSLPSDTQTMQAAVEAEGTDREAKRLLIGGLSYLLRKIDIVPDYLAGVGVVDDALVLRFASAQAVQAGLGDLDAEKAGPIEALGSSVGQAKEYLGDLYDMLDTYVSSLPDEAVRGRNADKIIDDGEARKQFARELKDELDNYAPRPITDPDRAARELKSFIRAKLDR